MHKKFFTFAIPVVGALALAGSGFAAWTFTNGASTDTLTGTIGVTDILDGFKVEVLQKDTTDALEEFTLTLDQGGPDNDDVTVGATSNHTAYDLKLSFETETGNALESILATHKLSFTYTVAVTDFDSTGSSETFTNYVDLTDDSKGNSTATELDDISDFTTDGTNHYYLVEDVPLEWKYINKPANKNDYDAMKAALNGKKFTITVTVTPTWVEK